MLLSNPETQLHIVAAAFLLYCMVADIRNHSIPNAAWIVGAAILIPLRFMVETSAPDTLAWGFGLTGVALLFWFLNLWGGADAKGTILLAWALPPFTVGPVTAHPLLYAIPISLLGVLVWQRIRTAPVPFFAIYSPILWLLFFLLWFIR